jgi:hypothetical protein
MEHPIETVTEILTELTRFTTNYFHSVFILITHNLYMFRPYIVAIFRELTSLVDVLSYKSAKLVTP